MYLVFLSGDGHKHVRRVAGKGVRMLAHPSQVPLYCAMEDYVEVCSYNQVDCSRADCSPEPEPGRILDEMENVVANPEHGGWRVLTDEEFGALEFAFKLREQQGDKDEQMGAKFMHSALNLGLYISHPLVRAGVGFATGGIHTYSLMMILNEIYDIRRFTHPHGLQRVGRLRNHFRVVRPDRVLKAYKHVEAEDSRTDEAGRRVSMVVCGWCTCDLLRVPRQMLEANPCLFLYREFYDYYDVLKHHHGDDQACALAVWRVTLRYLSFVYHLWMSAVIDDYEFDAMRFFGQESLVSTFSDYIKQIGN